MANSLYKDPEFSPQVKHNGFDMSMRRLFTAPVGMILPVYTDIVQANDKYKLNVDAFIRTEAVQTAAFQNFRAHFDWFFVPFRQMYQFWNEFYNGTFDVNTDYVKVDDAYKLPTMTFNFSPGSISSTWNGVGTGSVFIDKSHTGDPNVYAAYDNFGSPILGNAIRLADLLGYGDLHRYATGEFGAINNFDIFPYKYLAYHKIFYHPKFNRGDWFKRDNTLFNVDSYHGKKIADDVAARIVSTIHYRPFRRDYFSGIFPNPVFSKDYANIVGDSFIMDSYAVNLLSPEVQFVDGSTSVGLYNAQMANGFGTVKLQMDTPSSPSLDVDTLNALYDFDKLCRITALAGSHYTDQLKAHFGVTVNNDIHNEADYIGSQSIDISISEVVATATTGSSDSGSNLGDIAGKGFGVSKNDGDLNFVAKEQGVLMCVFSIEPLQMYSSKMIERNGLYRHPFDFFRRELDNLGMQPMTASELYDQHASISDSDNVLGYNYRYSELKTKVDIVNLGFTTVKTDWQCNFQDSIDLHTLNRDYRFYINPAYTDNIFAQHYVTPPYLLQKLTQGGDAGAHFTDWSTFTNMDVFKGDNFLINADFRVLKDSIMSVHSLPSLN